MRKLIGLFLLRVVLSLFSRPAFLAPSLSESFYFRLPCARGGGRRGTSLTEGLLHTRKSDPYTPSASHPFGTSLSEGGKRVGALVLHEGVRGWRGSRARQEKKSARSPRGRLVEAEQMLQAATFLAALLRCSPLLFPQKSQHDFCGIPEQNAKRKSPMSFLIGPFLAIGLSINQTVASILN